MSVWAFVTEDGPEIVTFGGGGPVFDLDETRRLIEVVESHPDEDEGDAL